MSVSASLDSASALRDPATDYSWAAWGDLADDPAVNWLRGLPALPQVDFPHSVQVTRLALALFDALAGPLHLASEGRRELAAASFWHDSGQSISEQRHHKHGFNLIMALDLPQWDASRQRRVACIARYHRKQLPRGSHEGFGDLDKASRERVCQLASLLRIADGLDRTHQALVRTVQVGRLEDRVLRLTVQASPETASELFWAARKSDLFEETFGRSVEFSLEFP
jgi:exopolyphosphatase / guanosine-5'-triphosphate,3'-diphosphate pyrophosphatase